MLQSVTSWNCVSCIFSVSFGGVWLSFCLRLMFLASSGVYLKIRRFAATWHIESEIFLSFGSSPSHGTEIAIFDFTLSFSPSLLILFSNIVHGDARKASGSHNKGLIISDGQWRAEHSNVALCTLQLHDPSHGANLPMYRLGGPEQQTASSVTSWAGLALVSRANINHPEAFKSMR